jgi:hypothetical protein
MILLTGFLIPSHPITASVSAVVPSSNFMIHDQSSGIWISFNVLDALLEMCESITFRQELDQLV